jgi:hypothetical protein
MEMEVFEIVISQGRRRGWRLPEQGGLGWLQLCGPKGRRASRDWDSHGEVCHASLAAFGRQMLSQAPDYTIFDILAEISIISGFIGGRFAGSNRLFAAG